MVKTRFSVAYVSELVKSKTIGLVGITPQLGEYIEFSLAPARRSDFLKQHVPPGICFQSIARVFKSDIYIDCIVECLHDAYVYYAYTTEGRGDELYYFGTKNRIFHGEKIWSAYHPFVTRLQTLHPSAFVPESSWFVGSRNNYTHQLVDFIPNLLHRIDLGHLVPVTHANVFGRTNSILESLLEVPRIRQALHQPSIFLESMGKPSKIDTWSVRCVQFKTLYLVRHLSIFRAFDMLRSCFEVMKYDTNGLVASSQNRGDLLYLSRMDNRVVNQADLESHLSSRWGADILKGIHNYSFAEKASAVSNYRTIILPPGSDNINAFCFADTKTNFCQLTALPCSELLQSPFTSFAGLRYILPFLDRTIFLESNSLTANNGIHSGIWAPQAIDQILQVS